MVPNTNEVVRVPLVQVVYDLMQDFGRQCGELGLGRSRSSGGGSAVEDRVEALGCAVCEGVGHCGVSLVSCLV